MRFKGKQAFITGSSRGIGRGIALKLAQEGATIGVHYFRNHEAAADTLAQVRELGSDGLIVQGDVSKVDDLRRMFAEIRDTFETLDIFVSNARGELATFYEPPLDLTLDQWTTAFDTQARAFFIGAKEAAALMPRGGRILAITFAPGARTGSWQPWIAMGSAKAALESTCRYFAVALASRAITVNAISPGLTEDSVVNTLPEEAVQLARAWHQRWTPMGRLGTPADVGNVAALLCSDEAAWITGQVVCADGGASLMDTVLPLELQLPRMVAV
ncbi:MAG TPA: SDR family oxidoreductase [Vicinamibacterales bacterium]|nr:SDR family oxidoreductase [Vicinamibacterales bacterium]